MFCGVGGRQGRGFRHEQESCADIILTGHVSNVLKRTFQLSFLIFWTKEWWQEVNIWKNLVCRTILLSDLNTTGGNSCPFLAHSVSVRLAAIFAAMWPTERWNLDPTSLGIAEFNIVEPLDHRCWTVCIYSKYILSSWVDRPLASIRDLKIAVFGVRVSYPYPYP